MTSTQKQVLELLSPAKNADTGIEAIKHGADAVYIGGPGYGARADASNTFDDLRRLVEFAHLYNARVYMTLNTILTDDELRQAVDFAWQAYECGVDALIIQDMGLLECDLPPIQLHASTQCDIRTAEKARFMQSIGCSQIVLARETDLQGIAEAYQVLDKARIEYFIHGALCVSYSGRCYASCAANNRSANRGECAQLCRLPYSVFREDGTLLVREKHVLSLKDNNQSDNLSALIQAGVRSFKIEGRLKDIGYVKNITAYYRQLLDQYIKEHPQFTASSDGHCRYLFTPEPKKSFNRGFTQYFTNGRNHEDLTVFDTPKNTGIAVADILRVRADYLDVRSQDDLHNGDGLTYLNRQGELQGFQVNRAEDMGNRVWRLFLREHPIYRRHPQLAPGDQLYRNRDKLWDELMQRDSAERRIGVSARWYTDTDGFGLTLTDERGIQVSVHMPAEHMNPTQDVSRNEHSIRQGLSQMGNTIFEVTTIDIEDMNTFAPLGFIKNLRRKALEALLKARAQAFVPLKRLSAEEPTLAYHGDNDFRCNVFNEKAVRFYANHGTMIQEKALENGDIHREIPLMQCKYCLRRALDLCLKDHLEMVKADPSLKDRFRPDPLILKTANRIYRATFDCKACEMTIWGKSSRF